MRAHRLGVSAVGLGGTLLLHMLLVLPIFLDLSLPAPQPPSRTGAGATAVVSSEEPVMTVVFINEVSRPADPLQPLQLERLASRGFAPPDLPVLVFSPDPSPATRAPTSKDVWDGSEPAEAAGDQAQHALLYGRYMGQIHARIERAWLRPRTAIGAPRFSCLTRIEQDRHANVVGIKLDHCNGTERWRQSLLNAIRSASPLPAPPDESVYADTLWLRFRSEAFQAGRSADGYEPETWAGLREAQARESFERFATGADSRFQSGSREGSDVVRLTIIGSRSGTPPQAAPANGSTVEPSPDVAPEPGSSPEPPTNSERY